ncbi:MAG: hypothetical protein LBO77_08480 [Desulfovibrio sp.]|nr:hypothetical protein [Desulfovibrio sp.]
MKTEPLQTIRGYVQALPRTPGGEDAARVAVIAGDGTEYHIAHKGAGMDLADFISADVEARGSVSSLPARGTLQEEDEPEKTRAFLLTVRSYRLTDGFDDPWYDDDA